MHSEILPIPPVQVVNGVGDVFSLHVIDLLITSQRIAVLPQQTAFKVSLEVR